MRVWKLVLIIWVTIWLLFIVRGLAKGELKEFRALCLKSLHEKNSHILGRELNEFVDACKNDMPDDCTYKILGNLDEHNKVRLIYHLYPRTVSEDPDYILNISPGESKYSLKKIE